MLPDHLRNKRIGVLGFGANHRALLAWLLDHGATDVTVYDENSAVAEQIGQAGIDVPVVVGADALGRVEADVVFRTPGLPLRRLDMLRAKGVTVTSQTELFLELCPARTIGVTGTKGKGTTSSLIAHILEGAGQRVFLAGNIGADPFAFLDDLTHGDTVVLELSSFQLDGIVVSPSVAVVLGVTSDHLDHHESLAAYREAKANIVRHQNPSDVAILNLDSPTALGYAAAAGGTVLYYSAHKSVDAGCYLLDGAYYWRDPRNEVPELIGSTETLAIQSAHNQENAAAAIAVAKLLGVSTSQVVAGVRSFPGLPHRTEMVMERDGVRWINDSYATVPDATIAAINAFRDPTLLIVGGSSKGADYTLLGAAIARADIKQLIALGPTGPQIAEAAHAAGFSREYTKIVSDLQSAVATAELSAKPGDVVLFSPASASFDQFKNAAERGERFRDLAKGRHATL